jgi:hypothetical protein
MVGLLKSNFDQAILLFEKFEIDEENEEIIAEKIVENLEPSFIISKLGEIEKIVSLISIGLPISKRYPDLFIELIEKLTSDETLL